MEIIWNSHFLFQHNFIWSEMIIQVKKEMSGQWDDRPVKALPMTEYSIIPGSHMTSTSCFLTFTFAPWQITAHTQQISVIKRFLNFFLKNYVLCVDALPIYIYISFCTPRVCLVPARPEEGFRYLGTGGKQGGLVPCRTALELTQPSNRGYWSITVHVPDQEENLGQSAREHKAVSQVLCTSPIDCCFLYSSLDVNVVGLAINIYRKKWVILSLLQVSCGIGLRSHFISTS